LRHTAHSKLLMPPPIMKLADALNALQLVPADSARAVAAAEFARKWRCAGLRDVSVRQVHRWLLDLERLNLVSSTTDGAGMRRYHRGAYGAALCRQCVGSPAGRISWISHA
jgi:hypothetical protein